MNLEETQQMLNEAIIIITALEDNASEEIKPLINNFFQKMSYYDQMDDVDYEISQQSKLINEEPIEEYNGDESDKFLQ